MAARIGRLWSLPQEMSLGRKKVTPRGQRAAVPAGPGRTLTILGAVRRGGSVAARTAEAATDGDIFLAYPEQVLCPRLRRGDVVVRDNLAAYKAAGVRERIEAAGAAVLYLPSYAPDFHPLEPCWAQGKQRLRAAKARSLSRLESYPGQALAAVTPQAVQGCFRHCGHGL